MGSYQVDDRVDKMTGYSFPGIVVAVFKTTEGKERIVVEHLYSVGMLHIFSPEQLCLA